MPIPLKVTLGALYWVGALLFLLMFKLRESNLSVPVAQALYLIGTGWLVFTLYMVIGLLFVDLLKLFHLRFAYSFPVLLGVVVCVLLYGYINYKHTRVRTIDLTIDKPIDSADKTLRVVGVSDLHLGLGTGKATLKKYVDLINEQRPDLVLIAGDLVDNSVVPLRRQKMEEELAMIDAPLGVYLCPGNHEYISGMKESEEYLSHTAVHLLSDSIAVLPNRVQIVGRNDRSSRSRKTVAALVHEADPAYPLILLDHQPTELGQAAEAGIDLQLSGHTHDGQVWPLNLVTNRLFELSYGYMQKGNTHFYTSSGLSLWGPPFRIGTVSELVVFRLTFK